MALATQVTFDCSDPNTLARFWAAALGYELQAPPAQFKTWDEALDAWGVPADQRNARSACVDPDGTGPRLFFQRVPEEKEGKNRLHLDVRAAEGVPAEQRMDHLAAKQAELEGLGARFLYRMEPDPARKEDGFITMADPEGNEFCLD